SNVMLARGAKPGTEVAEVVDVRAGEHLGAGPFTRDRGQDVVQLGLAVVATIRAVAAVTIARQLVRGHGPVLDPDRARDLPGPVKLACCERGRDGGHGDGVAAEHAVAARGDERRCDADGDGTADTVARFSPRRARPITSAPCPH